jgi:putative endonuclease
MSQRRKQLGKLGENLAKRLLVNKGYRFLTANFSCRWGEIDLIFQDHETIVFVEVKCRYSSRFGVPEEAVNRKKLSSLEKTIDYFYTRFPRLPHLCRIDVVGIELDPATLKPTAFRHVPNVTG